MADTNLSKANKPSFGTRVKRFFKDTKAELKKVTWPNKEQLIHNTGVIIVFILIITIILSVLDFGFAKLFQLLTNISLKELLGKENGYGRRSKMVCGTHIFGL